MEEEDGEERGDDSRSGLCDREGDGHGEVLVADERGHLRDGPHRARQQTGQHCSRVQRRHVPLPDAVQHQIDAARSVHSQQVRQHVVQP